MGVEYSLVPKKIVVEKDSPWIRRSRKSNLRFVEEVKKDCFGKESIPVFWTEEFVGGKWNCIINSISTKKDAALELHLKLLDSVSINDTAEKTIHWEGLSKEETQTWAALKS